MKPRAPNATTNVKRSRSAKDSAFVYRCDGHLVLLAICIPLHVPRGHPPVGPCTGEALHGASGSGRHALPKFKERNFFLKSSLSSESGHVLAASRAAPRARRSNSYAKFRISVMLGDVLLCSVLFGLADGAALFDGGANIFKV